VDLNDDQWLQDSLPVGKGGLGIRSAQMLAPSVSLASVTSTSALQQSILLDSVNLLEDQSVASTKTRWSSLFGSTRPADEEQHIQKAWDKPVTKKSPSPILFKSSWWRWRFPSCCMRLTGSLVAGIWARLIALQTMSFTWWWRWCLEPLLRQHKPWSHQASTALPHGQVWVHRLCSIPLLWSLAACATDSFSGSQAVWWSRQGCGAP